MRLKITVPTNHQQNLMKLTLIGLRAGCSKAEPTNFRSAVDPLPGGAGRPKFNQREMVTTFTYKPSLLRIDARNFELSW